MQAGTIDITGMRFGKWTVISTAKPNKTGRNGATWLCRCDCGNEVEVRGANLRRGSSTQCRDCAWKANRAKTTSLQDLTGQRFGKWTVIERAPNVKYRGVITVMWKCRCDCGAVTNVQRGNLMGGKSTQCKSCGARAVYARRKEKQDNEN